MELNKKVARRNIGTLGHLWGGSRISEYATFKYVRYSVFSRVYFSSVMYMDTIHRYE